MLAHDVYFTLNESTPANRAKLVAACKKYLTGHPGEVFFAAGTLCEDLRRPVNDVAFDVALHLVVLDDGRPRRLPGRPAPRDVRRREQGDVEDGAGVAIRN